MAQHLWKFLVVCLALSVDSEGPLAGGDAGVPAGVGGGDGGVCVAAGRSLLLFQPVALDVCLAVDSDSPPSQTLSISSSQSSQSSSTVTASPTPAKEDVAAVEDEEELMESFEEWVDRHIEKSPSASPSRPPHSAPSSTASEQPATTSQPPATDTPPGKEEKAAIPPNPIIHPRLTTSPSKDRFNFASFDCGAVIRSSNSEAKSSTAILSGNKDAYMLNNCDSLQYVVIELCNDILVDAVVLANLELFSSMFRDVRVSISNEYYSARDSIGPSPSGSAAGGSGKGWRVLANLLARNVRSEQLFVIPNAVMWAKFVKIEFVSHYGSEFYCPVTLVRIFGKTMMEDLRAVDDDSDDSGDVKHGSPRKRPSHNPQSGGVVKYSGPQFQMDKDIEDLLASGELPFLQDVSSQQPPLSDEDSSKDSVFKSILKRLNKLERNVTFSYAYLAFHHKRLQSVYTHLDGSIHAKVDVFLNKLGREVVDGMHGVIDEYENALDSWISDLSVLKRQTKKDVDQLKSRFDTLAYMVILALLAVVVQFVWQAPIVDTCKRLFRRLIVDDRPVGRTMDIRTPRASDSSRTSYLTPNGTPSKSFEKAILAIPPRLNITTKLPPNTGSAITSSTMEPLQGSGISQGLLSRRRKRRKRRNSI